MQLGDVTLDFFVLFLDWRRGGTPFALLFSAKEEYTDVGVLVFSLRLGGTFVLLLDFDLPDCLDSDEETDFGNETSEYVSDSEE